MEANSTTLAAASLGVLLIGPAFAASAGETPKNGGILNYVIPADAPPSFDAHRETTFATIHSAAPFYSVLIRVDPNNPSSTTDFVCDLCTAMPQPIDGGKTYTFKIRDGVKWHDGSPLTASDVAASWEHIIHPPEGVLSPRESHYVMVDTVEAPDPTTVVFHLKFATSAFLPALADPYSWIYKKRKFSTRTPAGTSTTSSARARSNSPLTRSASQSRECATPIIITRDCHISTALPGSMPTNRQSGSMLSAPTAQQSSSAVSRPRCATSSSLHWATRSRCKPATGTAAALSSPTTRKSRSTTLGCAAH